MGTVMEKLFALGITSNMHIEWDIKEVIMEMLEVFYAYILLVKTSHFLETKKHLIYLSLGVF